MKRKIVVVGDANDIVGFRLAGVSQTYDIGLEGTVDKLPKKDAIIFITKKAKEKLGGQMEMIMRDNIVQEIPSGDGKYTRVRSIIKDTVGFELG
ncbi:MAG: V-type ATP synthase subunit F [Candidatus Altiarchaeota archaeon]